MPRQYFVPKFYRYLVIAGVVAVLALILQPLAAYADVNDFTITDFTADYTLTQRDPQGALAVHETVAVDFSDYNHGILRALPQRYNGQTQRLHITAVKRDGATESYSTYSSNGNLVLKIGDAARTITGVHSYTIDYDVENVIRFEAGKNQLIWNTNGTQWTQPFLKETARLHVPSSLISKQSDMRCYTGPEGSTTQDCTYETDGATTTFVTARTLQPGETMTFAVAFPQGTFASPTAADWWHDNGLKVIAVAVPVILAFLIAYRKWHRDGKDIRGRGTIIPEYQPPENMSPALADTLLQYRLSSKGVSATIIDLAIRRYLNIVESEEGGLLGIGKHKVYTFEKLELPTDNLISHDKAILDGLFSGRNNVTTTQLKNQFYTTVDLVNKDLDYQLLHGMYVPRSQLSTYLSFLGWIIAFGAGLAIFSAWFPYASVGFGIGIAVFVGFTLLMPKRTQLGVDAKDRLEGLKLYMDTAEKDRLAMLQSVDAPYAERAQEPAKTIELFEKLLPFAIVLGVEKSWAKQFEGLYSNPPEWYGGNWTSFNTGFLVGSLSDSMNAMNASFAAPSSSGSGGGGGFSGGGGGGGGGGGW